MIDSKIRKYVQFLFNALASFLIRIKLSANQVTVLALIAGICSGLVLLPRWYSLSLTLLWLSGLFDVLDGSVARLSKSSSPLGAFLDLIFDRVVEAFFIILFALSHPELSTAAMVFLGSVIFNFSTFMVAGNLFKNESEKSMHYDVGIIERTETFIAFSLMLILPSYAVLILFIFNIMILFTGVLRFSRIVKFAMNKG